MFQGLSRTIGGWGDSIRTLVEDVIDAVYPDRCPLCAEPPSPGDPAAACASHALPGPEGRRRVPRCGRCARPLSPALPDGTRCAPCRRAPPRFVRVLTLGDYRRDQEFGDSALREWILAFKHGGRRDLVEPLAAALGGLLVASQGESRGRASATRTLLVPVPLHPLRRLERGYDQARLLARAVAELCGYSYRPLLRRTRWTVPQGSSAALSRRANVHDAFLVRSSASLDLVGVRVWLVDDVLTSGATADACVAPLTRLGARRVGVLCLARAGEAEGPGLP